MIRISALVAWFWSAQRGDTVSRREWERTAVFVDKTHVTSGLVEDCHGLDLQVIARVINSEEEFLLMEAMENDGVVSDFPDRIVAWRMPRYRGKHFAMCE